MSNTIRAPGRNITIGEAVRKLNPGVFNAAAPAAEGKRIRQETGPILNRLELEWGERLKELPDLVCLRPQAVRFKIANGAWYKPDWVSWHPAGRMICWECKGPKEVKGCAKGLLALKAAAKEYPDVRFVLVWRDSSGWQTQQVLP